MPFFSHDLDYQTLIDQSLDAFMHRLQTDLHLTSGIITPDLDVRGALQAGTLGQILMQLAHFAQHGTPADRETILGLAWQIIPATYPMVPMRTLEPQSFPQDFLPVFLTSPLGILINEARLRCYPINDLMTIGRAAKYFDERGEQITRGMIYEMYHAGKIYVLRRVLDPIEKRLYIPPDLIDVIRQEVRPVGPSRIEKWRQTQHE